MKKLVKEDLLLEGFESESTRRLDKLFNLIGYDDYYDFIQDNPGCVEAMINWIEEFFGKDLKEKGLSPDELEEVGLYGLADRIRNESE